MRICVFDAPLMILIGFVFAGLYAKWLIKKNADIYVIGYWVMVILAWINGFWFHWFTEKFVAEAPFWIGFFYVFSYGIWFTWGATRFFELFGYTPEQGGIFWLFGVKDRTKPFQGWKR